MHSTQVVLVIKLLVGSISLQYHIVFDDVLSTLVSSTAANPEVFIRLSTTRKSIIHVILEHDNDPYLFDKYLTDDAHLNNLSKYIERIVGIFKGLETTFVQGPQSSEEDLPAR